MQHDPQDEPLQPLAEQKPLDFLRAEQLRLLRDCELPRDAKDKKGHGVSAVALKGMLTAIDHFGRGRPGGAFASVATLAATANVGQRTATRAVEVLEMLGLVCRDGDGVRWGQRGSPTNRYTIVWSELAIRCYENPLARGANQSAPARENHRAPATDQSAPATDQSALGTDQSALGTDQSAPRGAQSASKRLEALLNAPTVDCRDEDGARYFFGDELAAVRAKANTINDRAQARTLADRELVLKIATLWHDRQLSDNAVEQVLESYQRKRDAGDPVVRTMAWLWTTMRDKCRRDGVKFERLLATCEFPQELLPAPAASTT